MKDFAKLFRFDDIGQVLVTLDEAEGDDVSGPEIKISFIPKGFGVSAVKLANFGTDKDEAWNKAEKAFDTIDEAFAYKTAKRVIDQFTEMFPQKGKSE